MNLNVLLADLLHNMRQRAGVMMLLCTMLSFAEKSLAYHIVDSPHFLRFQIFHTSRLSEAIVENAQGISPKRAAELIDLGSVYISDDLNSKEKRTTLNVQLPPGSCVRVHHSPQRYPACTETDWKQRVLYIDQDYVVVDKPWGVVTMPHVSNCKEVLHKCVANNLGLDPLVPLNRIDEFASGIVVSARNKEAASNFQQMLQQKQVSKKYKTLSFGRSPKVGKIIHYMCREPFFRMPAPRPISDKRHDNKWKHCELVIEKTKEFSSGLSSVTNLFESEVDLITGRTHQIRAQFSAIGSPLIFDTHYIPMAEHLIHDYPLKGHDNINNLKSLMLECKKPVHGIGLYCSEIQFGNIKVSGRGPWWQKEKMNGSLQEQAFEQHTII
mmetsp:Transcript_41315/g.54298  ORF Transcript_41315/g.54298 Transcript_41315/m.54298 type:complete len:382 (+) Transcript_41315:140-1285(+)